MWLEFESRATVINLESNWCLKVILCHAHGQAGKSKVISFFFDPRLCSWSLSNKLWCPFWKGKSFFVRYVEISCWWSTVMLMKTHWYSPTLRALMRLGQQSEAKVECSTVSNHCQPLISCSRMLGRVEIEIFLFLFQGWQWLLHGEQPLSTSRMAGSVGKFLQVLIIDSSNTEAPSLLSSISWCLPHRFHFDRRHPSSTAPSQAPSLLPFVNPPHSCLHVK